MKKQIKTLKKKPAKKKAPAKKSKSKKKLASKASVKKKETVRKKTTKKKVKVLKKKAAKKTQKSSKSKFNVVVKKAKKKLGARDGIYVQDLPFSYNETKLVLLPRDPESFFLYWDFSEETWRWIQDLYSEHHSLWPKIRIHTRGDAEYFEMDVSLDAKKWYVHLAAFSGQTLFAELGLVDEQGQFYLIAKSQWIKIPRNSPSDVIDPDWAPADFEEIYRLSGGQGIAGSSDILSSPDIVPEEN